MRSDFQFLTYEEECAFIKLQLARENRPVVKRKCDNNGFPKAKRVCFHRAPIVKYEESSFPDSALPSTKIQQATDVDICNLMSIPEPIVNFIPQPFFARFTDVKVPEKTKQKSIIKEPPAEAKKRKARRKSKPRKDKTKYHPVLQTETKRANQVTLHCAHCGIQFSAKATYRKRFGHYLVNHACCGRKRTQFVIGRKHKRCTFGCAASLGCIRFVLC